MNPQEPSTNQNVQSSSPNTVSTQPNSNSIPPQPASPTYTQPSFQNPMPQQKSKLWIWVSVGLAVLVVIAVALFILVYPTMQARAVADKFVTAVKNNDSQALKDLSGDGSDSLTEKATKGLKGATYKVKSTTKKDVGYVIVYDVKDSDTLKDMTIVTKDGKVTTFNINSTGSSSKEEDSSNEVSTSTSSCMSADDLKNAGIGYIDQTALDSGVRSGNGTYLGELFFQPDSTNYLSDGVASSELDRLAKVYSANKDKTFFYMVRGSVREDSSSSAGKDLANRRADKIKSEFVKRGVPADMVKLYQPVNGASASSSDVDRRIDVNINVECTAGTGR